VSGSNRSHQLDGVGKVKIAGEKSLTDNYLNDIGAGRLCGA
jgi:hypothetical protein